MEITSGAQELRQKEIKINRRNGREKKKLSRKMTQNECDDSKKDKSEWQAENGARDGTNKDKNTLIERNLKCVPMLK